jgi:centromere/kinetochore protein ZW10
LSSLPSSPRGVDGGNDDNDDGVDATGGNNSSFHLGMDLFGPDPSMVERQIRDKLEDLENELDRVLTLSDGDGTEDRMTSSSSLLLDATSDSDTNNSSHRIRLTIHEYQSKVAFLKRASLARSALDEATTLGSAALSVEPDLGQASRQLVEAQGHIHALKEMAANTNTTTITTVAEQQQILDSLQQTLRRQRLELLHKANTILDSSLQLDANQLSVKSSSHLEQAFDVLETLEGGALSLEDTLRRFIRRLYDQVITPLLDPIRAGQPSSHLLAPTLIHQRQDEPTKRIIGVSTSTTRGKVHRIEWYRPELTDAAPLDWPMGVWKDTLSTLQQVLQFVQSHMLLGRTKAATFLGRKLFGTPTALPSHLHLQALGLESTILGDDFGLVMHDLVRLLEQTCLFDHLPPSELNAMLEQRQVDLKAALQPFCQAMQDCELLRTTDSNQLMDFVDHLPDKYVEHRRCLLLNQARDILRNHDYHNTIAVGVSDDDAEKEDPGMAIFIIQRSGVSEVASELIKLIRTTMAESTAAPIMPSTLRPALYKAAREMLTLFRAIIPAMHGTEIASVPRTAAVFHNDCIFLAHHCLTLGVEFKEHYSEDDARGKLLSQSCIFVDNVPLFRELADQSLGDMLDVQANVLVEIVGGRIGYLGAALQSHESLLEWSEAETASAAGVYHLRHLAQAWRPILSRRIFGQTMGHLADVILNLFWKQVVQSASLMTPNARHFLVGLFRQMSHDLKELFENPQPERCLEDCSTEWGRFEALVQFLEMSHLAQVQSALASGVFRHVAAPELAKLLQATFVDSAERQVLLHSLSKV